MIIRMYSIVSIQAEKKYAIAFYLMVSPHYIDFEVFKILQVNTINVKTKIFPSLFLKLFLFLLLTLLSSIL